MTTHPELVRAGIARFVGQMQLANIHVGLGYAGAVRCVTCGGPWPCPDSGITIGEPHQPAGAVGAERCAACLEPWPCAAAS